MLQINLTAASPNIRLHGPASSGVMPRSYNWDTLEEQLKAKSM